MNKRVTVVFDGTVLRPDTHLDLTPNKRYIVTVQELNKEALPSLDAWDVLEEMTGTVEAPSDWSSEHNHYLYGTPKKGSLDTP